MMRAWVNSIVTKLSQPFRRIGKPYLNVYRNLYDYWAAYGGLRAILLSPYMHAAAGTTIALNHVWSKAGWWELPLSVLPNLIGFTLGALAVLTGWASREFVKALMETKIDGNTSIYKGLMASLVHFVVVQISALLLAVVARGRPFSDDGSVAWRLVSGHIDVAYWRPLFTEFCWGIGYFAFLYAIFLALAAVLAVFQVVDMDESFSDRSDS